MSDVTEVVAAYFSAIRSRDIDGLYSLFGAEAVVTDYEETVYGRDKILERYESRFFGSEDLYPRPGKLLVDGDRVAVEIEVTLNGEVLQVADFFSIADGKIERLSIYAYPKREE